MGSSSWISCATKKPAFDREMRIFNWVHLDPEYVTPCGTMQAAGYSLRWLRDTLCDTERETAEKTEKSAYSLIDKAALRSPAGSNGLLYLPYLLGERSPRWNREAKGSFVGLSMTTARDDILRSVLEGVGYNLKVIMDIMEQSVPIGDVIAIGGGAKSDVWLQILSDIWQKPLSVPRYLEEATSLGAAVCAGVGTGIFKDFSVIERLNPIERKIIPNPQTREIYNKLFAAFNEAYDGLIPTFSMLADLRIR
ncbi:MAG: FGGY-family carbohydrate kinase [Oscillospiraceae bacterium]